MENKPQIKSLEERLARVEQENEILKEAHEELLNQLAEAEKAAVFDSLTGLKRRSFFEEEIKSFLEFVRPDTTGQEDDRGSSTSIQVVSLVVFDIDHFKKVNDTHGHRFGDEVLAVVAETIRNHTRKSDIAVRWGGEEMAVAMIGANEEDAQTRAGFIKDKISKLEFSTHPDFKITISAGVAASSRENFKEFQELFEDADTALYTSKNNGRNQVTVHKSL